MLANLTDSTKKLSNYKPISPAAYKITVQLYIWIYSCRMTFIQLQANLSCD